jgi:hypothetical protein
MLVFDVELGSKDLQGLSSTAAIVGFFAKLGYDTSSRAKVHLQGPANMRLHCRTSHWGTLRWNGHLLRLRGCIFRKRPLLFFMRARRFHSRHPDCRAG